MRKTIFIKGYLKFQKKNPKEEHGLLSIICMVEMLTEAPEVRLLKIHRRRLKEAKGVERHKQADPPPNIQALLNKWQEKER